MLAQSTPTSSDSFSTSSSSDFSPEIISQTPPTLQQQQPLAHSGPGATRRLSYKNATNLQQIFLAAHNQTPSIHPASSTPNAFGVQSQLCEILTEVKKTNERISQYDGRLESMEQRLINLEQSTTWCSSDEFSQPLKRKVPPHVRLHRYLMKMFTIFLHVLLVCLQPLYLFLFEKFQQLVRDLYRSLHEEDEHFEGFDVKQVIIIIYSKRFLY